MVERLKDKVAFVTGASQGIGEAIAARFAEEGAQVVICSRRRDAIEAAASRIRSRGGRVNAHVLDVAEHDALARLVQQIGEEHGRLDILVNNAASVTYSAITDMSVETFRQDFRVNVDSAFVAIREALKLMRARKSGSIVNIASINGLLAVPNMSAYGAAKAAMIHFSRYAAMEGAPDGVRVNAIAPGVINTPATEAGFAGPHAEWGRRIAAQVPMGRFGEALEVANVALFLASDDASYVTGVCLSVDGGKAVEIAIPSP